MGEEFLQGINSLRDMGDVGVLSCELCTSYGKVRRLASSYCMGFQNFVARISLPEFRCQNFVVSKVKIKNKIKFYEKGSKHIFFAFF